MKRHKENVRAMLTAEELSKEIEDIRNRMNVIEELLHIDYGAEKPQIECDLKVDLGDIAVVAKKIEAPVEKIKKKSISLDEILGKYVIGIIASLLTFIAAISLTALVWGRINDSSKFGLLVGIGILLMLRGYEWLNSKNNKIVPSLILGTGAGLTFIAIGAGRIAFELYGDGLALSMIAAWMLSLTYLSKRMNLFFVSVIAYIGSFIAINFMLYKADDIVSIAIVVVFTAAAATTVSICGRTEMFSKRLMASNLMSFALVALVAVQIHEAHYLSDWNRLMAKIVLVGLAIVFYGGLAMSECDIRRRVRNISSEAMLVSLMLLVSYLFGGGGYFSLGDISMWEGIVAAGLWVVILIISYQYNVAAIVMIPILMSQHVNGLMDLPWGIAGFGALALWSLKAGNIVYSKHKRNYGLTLALIALAGIFAWSWDARLGVFGVMLFLAEFALLGQAVYTIIKERYNEFDDMIIITSKMCMSVMLVSAMVKFKTGESSFVLKLAVAATYYILVFASGYLCRGQDGFKWFSKKLKRYDISELRENYWRLVTTGIYEAGVITMCITSILHERMVLFGLMLALLLINSYIVVHTERENKLIVGLMVFKYCEFVWAFVFCTTGAGVTSILISVATMVLALAFIYGSFRFKIKSLSLYGMGIVMAMTLKIVVVDLSYAEGITRILALAAGSIVCFMISTVYNKKINEKNV